MVDRVGLGVLAAQFPGALVDRVVAETGRREKRVRDLPAALMVRYVVALALFPSDGYDEVMRQVKVADDWLSDRAGSVKVPATTAITKARDRLGVAPVRLLFERTAVAMALPGRTVGAFYRGWRVCAVDGTTLLVPDTDENAAAFGKPGNDSGEGALPQVRVLGLVECGTRALLGAGFGGTGGSKMASEQALFGDLLPALRPGLLVLADRNFLGFELFEKTAATGADLLWQVKKDRGLPVDAELADGSYLSHLVEPGTRGKGRTIPVRVVEYTLDRDPGTGEHKGDLPAGHHGPRPRHRARRRPGRALQRPGGSRDPPRRNQGPPAGQPAGPAVPEPRPGRAGGLGRPAAAPGVTETDPRHRTARGDRPRPALLHPHRQSRPPPGRAPGAFPPPPHGPDPGRGDR